MKRGRGTSRLRGHLFANIRVNEFSSGSLWWRRRNNERRSRGGSGKQREIVGNYSTKLIRRLLDDAFSRVI